MKYFDFSNYRLIQTGQNATPEYWDEQWEDKNLEKKIKSGLKNRLIIGTTKKYISPNPSKKILEGGCGNGQFVYAFSQLGYDSYGVDYAPNIISQIKNIFPDLKVSVGDVRKSDFPDNYFDGYWSIGVIEHFLEGYDTVISETSRVLKPEGFLFITFPHLSCLRKLKIKWGLYPGFNENQVKKEGFYQFLLSHTEVISKIEKSGFKLIEKRRFSGLKGLKDEVIILKPLLQRIYDAKNIIIKVINYSLSLILSPFSSHAILLVFRKK